MSWICNVSYKTLGFWRFSVTMQQCPWPVPPRTGCLLSLLCFEQQLHPCVSEGSPERSLQGVLGFGVGVSVQQAVCEPAELQGQDH